MKIGIALGSGSSRGFVHIGILRAIEKTDLEISMISGSSVGAIIGGMYAYGYTSDQIEGKILEYLEKPHIAKILNYMKKSETKEKSTFGEAKQWIREKLIFTRAVTRVSLIQSYFLKNFIDEVIPDTGEKSKIPFYVAVANLTNCEQSYFSDEDDVDIRDAILASAAIPGVFPPVEIGGSKYVDGAAVNPIPVSILKEKGADFVIGVGLPKRLESKKEFGSGAGVFLRANRAAIIALYNEQVKQADFMLTPYVGERSWSDFDKMSSLIEYGEKGFFEMESELKQKIREKKKIHFWNNVVRTMTFKQLSATNQ